MADTRKLRAASVQMEHTDNDKHANFAKIEKFTAEAAARNAHLVVFPECCVTGYWFIRNLSKQQLADLAEPIPNGPSTKRLRDLARQYAITIGAGWIESTSDGSFHNTYVVALPAGTIRSPLPRGPLKAVTHHVTEGGPLDWRVQLAEPVDADVSFVITPRAPK